MTANNTNNVNELKGLFQDLSEEAIASISGGESIITGASASAFLQNNVGGIVNTSAFTSAVDAGTHTGISKSASVSVAFNDTNNTPQILGPGTMLNLASFGF